MNQVIAFVGHSFTAEDDSVVSAFLKYFDQINGLYPAFNWQHATSSEPRDLRDKVLSIIDGKNTFIGICTRKERVIAGEDPVAAPFSKTKVQVSRDKLIWKTSDWVIQEIGLAIGLGMSIILLVEDGVRPPGGLQGNIEYIPFSRERPEASFGKLLEMIRALSPQSSIMTLALPEVTTSDAPDESEGEAAPADMPTPEWGISEYVRAHFFRLLRDDEDGAAKIDAAYLGSAHASVGDNKSLWRAKSEWAKIALDKKGSLAKLQELSEEFPSSPDIITYLGYALSKYGENLNSADCHAKAAKLAAEVDEKVAHLSRALVERAKAGRYDLSQDTLSEILDLGAGSVAAKKEILKAVQNLAELQKDSSLKVEALEGLVELSPEDVGLRFSLAYEHSQNENGDLALFHYLKIPEASRGSIAWNNLGVAFQQFGMPGKSVGAYRRAADEGETLAMSNLAYKFMEVGFFEEAGAEFSKALAVEDFHKNVGEGVAALKAAPEHENEKERETLAVVAAKANFYRALGQAIYSKWMMKSNRWQASNCQLDVKISENSFHAFGEYEVRVSPNILLGILNESTKKHRIEYRGKIVGRRVEGKVTRTSDGKSDTNSLFDLGSSPQDFIMIVDAAGESVQLTENPRSKMPTFSTLTVLT